MQIGLKRGTVLVEPHRIEWEIAAQETIGSLRKILKDDIIEAQSPAIPRLKRSRCRSSQEVNDSPTPFSALNYCLPALPMASMSLSYPNMAAYATMKPSTTAAATIYHTTAIALIWQ